MTVLLTVIFVIFADRIIPLNMRIFVVNDHVPIGLRLLYKNYRLIKFPRTLFAVLTCAASSLNLFIEIDRNLQAYIIAGCAALFGIFACVDAWKAEKMRS